MSGSNVSEPGTPNGAAKMLSALKCQRVRPRSPLVVRKSSPPSQATCPLASPRRPARQGGPSSESPALSGRRTWRVPPSAYLARRPAPFAVPARPRSRYLTMPDGCRLAVDVHRPASAPPARFPTICVFTPYYRRWDITIEEDNAICEMQQRGLASRINGRGRFCHRERVVHQIDNWVLDRVLAPAPIVPG